MKLDERDQAKLTRATQLALSWHAAQFRKGSTIPYASHLLQVAGLVLEHGGNVDQAVAGLLHDSLEDAESTNDRADREQMIREEFGAGVLDIVRACTDTEADEVLNKKAPWKERKTRYLRHLVDGDSRSALVAACDKRQNLGALVGDVRTHGVAYLDRFRAGASEQVWYFASVNDALRDQIPRRLALELDSNLADFRALVE